MKDQEKIKILKSISQTMILSELLDLMGQEIDKLNIGNYGIYLLDEKKENLFLKKFRIKEQYKELQNKHLTQVQFSLNRPSPLSDCAHQKKTLIMYEKDFEAYDSAYKQYFQYFQFQNIAVIPLIKGKDLLGVIQLNGNPEIDSYELGYTKDLIDLFFTPLQNALLVNELQTKENEIKTIFKKAERILELAVQMNNLDSLNNIYHLIIKELLDTYQFDIGTIYLKDGDLLKIRLVSYNHEEIRRQYEPINLEIIEYLEKNSWFNVRIHDSGLCTIFLNNISYFIYDFQLIKNAYPSTEKDQFTMNLLPNTRSILYIPIRKNNLPIGMIQMFTIQNPVNISQADIKVIESLCSFISTAIENARIYTLADEQKKLLEEKDLIIREDLSLAKRIQQNIISKEYKKYSQLDFYIHYEPQYEIGGDIYDILKLKDNYYRIFIADATGHGIQASLTTMIIKNEYDLLKTGEAAPNILLQELNRSFISKYYHLTVFFTALILDIDLTKNKIYYSSAGHPEQYMKQKDQILTLKTAGKMIGLYDKVQYNLQETDFQRTDQLILFTDGLFEEFNSNHEEFGTERIEEIMRKTAEEEPIFSFGKEIYSRMKDFIGSNPIQDDITLICVSLTNQPDQ